MSEINNGPLASWEYPANATSENMKMFVDKYIKPYFKGLDFCAIGDNEKCGAILSGNSPTYFLNNGVSISFYVAPTHLSIIFDIDSSKKPDVLGKNVFYFTTLTGSLKPYGWFSGIKRTDLINGYTNTNGETIECKKSKTDPDNPNELLRHGCTALLMLDGWEYKDDFPW